VASKVALTHCRPGGEGKYARFAVHLASSLTNFTGHKHIPGGAKEEERGDAPQCSWRITICLSVILLLPLTPPPPLPLAGSGLAALDPLELVKRQFKLISCNTCTLILIRISVSLNSFENLSSDELSLSIHMYLMPEMKSPAQSQYEAHNSGSWLRERVRHIV